MNALSSFLPQGDAHMTEIFLKGGPAMLALLLCSFIGVYIVIQKLLFLRFNRIDSIYIEKVKTTLITSGLQATIKRLKEDDHIISRVIANALRLAKLSRDDIQQGIKETTYAELPKLEKNMSLLTGIVTAAPMLGLLGTVLGLMRIFKVLSGGELGNTTAISGGIAEAMITTVAGLAIAIPFIFINHYLSHRVEGYMMDIERSVHEVLNFYKMSEHEIKA